MSSPSSIPHKPHADSVTALLQELMNANLSSAVLAGYFSQKSAANAPQFLSAEEALVYAGRLQELATCEKEMALLSGQLKEIQAAFPLRAAASTSYHDRAQGLSAAFKNGLGLKMGLYELDGIVKSNLHNLALAKKNLDPQKISMAIAASAKPTASPLMADKALASKLNL